MALRLMGKSNFENNNINYSLNSAISARRNDLSYGHLFIPYRSTIRIESTMENTRNKGSSILRWYYNTHLQTYVSQKTEKFCSALFVKRVISIISIDSQ